MVEFSYSFAKVDTSQTVEYIYFSTYFLLIDYTMFYGVFLKRRDILRLL